MTIFRFYFDPPVNISVTHSTFSSKGYMAIINLANFVLCWPRTQLRLIFVYYMKLYYYAMAVAFVAYSAMTDQP